MDDINELNLNSEVVLRKEPSKIYSYNVILTIFLITFILIGTFVKYHKYENFIASVKYLDEHYYLEVDLTKDKLENLDKYELYIDKKKYDYKIVEFTKNRYDNSYNVLVSIEDYEFKNFEYIVFSLRSEKTTLFKELLKRIKEELKN